MAIKTFISYNRNQKRGLIWLMGIVMIILVIRWKYNTYTYRHQPIPKIPAFKPLYSASPSPFVEINISPDSTWQKLYGIGPVLGARIVKYRHMIGGFHDISDISSVYGITDTLLTQIRPYLYQDSTLDLATLFPQQSTSSSYRSFKTNYPTLSLDDSLDINLADTTRWQMLPGIGKVLSKRIVNYREARGGFEQIANIKKVYGIHDTVFEHVKKYLYWDTLTYLASQKRWDQNKKTTDTIPANIHRDSAQYPTQSRSIPPRIALTTSHINSPININKADTTLLQSLPGIDAAMAGRIIKYRDLIGFYADVSQLQHVYGMRKSLFETISSVITVGNISQMPKLDLNMVPDWKLKKYPFLQDGKADLIIQQRKKLRRLDNWDEIAVIPALDAFTLKMLKLYFDI